MTDELTNNLSVGDYFLMEVNIGYMRDTNSFWGFRVLKIVFK